MTTTVNLNASLGGIQFNQSRSVASEALIAQERTLPAAQVGTLTTRTSTTVGTITMASGAHTITTAARVDLYWTENGILGARRGVVVGTVAGTAVPITAGLGDVLPTASVVINVALAVSLATSFLGAKMKAQFFGAPEARSQFVVCSAGNVEELAVLLPQGGVQSWDVNGLGVNPNAGDTIVNTWVSHGDATGAKKVQLAIQYDN